MHLLRGNRGFIGFIGMIAVIVGVAFPGTAAAAMDPSPVSFDWGNVDRYQQSFQQGFTFTNNEGVGVVPQAQLSGPDSGSFAIAGDNCSGQFVPDSGSCTVTLFVNPQSVGALAASLDVDDTLGVVSVPLAATAMTGTLNVNPDPIAFNPQPWFYGSQNVNVNGQVQNYGVAISDVEITGPDQALFSFDYNNCSPNQLPVNGGCSIGLRFNPTGPSGPAQASLVITSNSPASPQSIPITADSLTGPDPQITPGSDDFGAVAIGSSSAPQTFTLNNAGDFPVQIQQILVVSGTPQAFPILSDSCTQNVVNPGDDCTFDVAFAPTSVGPKEASIFLISSGPSPVTQIGLSGQGYNSPEAGALIEGTPEVGRILDCTPVNSIGELSYEWLRDGAALGGADEPSYTLGGADLGARMSCRITATNPIGTSSATSPQTAPVAARDLSGDSHSLVDEASCRLVQVDPISGVKVSGTDPATPESPLAFKANKRINVELGSLEGSGKQVRFNPRRLDNLDDGPQPLKVNGKPGQAVLAPCKLSGQVSGSRGGRTSYDLSGATGIESGSIKTPKLSIRPEGGSAGEVTVFAHGRPNVRFPISGKSTTYNGIRVRLARHEVKISGLFEETSLVEIDLDRGVVRGKGGTAKAKASLQGQGNARASFRTAWR